MSDRLEIAYAEASAALREAEAMVVTAGAGMGVDSGLPDFRGPEGFWAAYPAYRQLGLEFRQLANPQWFLADPALAWGFYGHRLSLYRRTRPHRGFHLLQQWSTHMKSGSFVFTSNVDGQFQMAGFDPDRLVECHGSIHTLQCLAQCGEPPFAAEAFQVEVDDTTFRAREPWPACRRCGGLARPNVLMFGDWDWDSTATQAQDRRLARWLDALGSARLIVVECGAGTSVPTVRHFGEQLCAERRAVLIRINVHEPEVPRGVRAVSLPLGAETALASLQALWDGSG